MIKTVVTLLTILISTVSFGQACYWQQKIDYKINVELNTENHSMVGKETITYDNNSPDTLSRIYIHLYFNAFQPGSMMDARSRTIKDPDGRVGSRIVALSDEEIGFHKINALKIDGKKADFIIDGTLMTVPLSTPLLPGKSLVIDMEFNSQVPKQIRRSGRDNVEGIDYTMTQWYPKVAEYDRDGWMTDEYVGREFHGVWGDFEVKIKLPKEYVVGATGYLQNPATIGHGYPANGDTPQLSDSDFNLWHFKAPNVHDFAWAADPDYQHDVRVTKSGLELHFFYLNDTSIAVNWKKLQPYTEENFSIVDSVFGKYPYKQYSVIQGGDGGMEYPMATMITGKGTLGGLVSVMVHESIHSWYYGLLATNETKYPWMDEGFTQSAQYFVMDRLFDREALNPAARAYKVYGTIATDPEAEPLSTHADFYHQNRMYGINSYYKGTVFLKQLEYIVGEDVYYPAMREYYYQWRFKHPTPTDFKKIMEKASGMNLDWYFQQFLGTTKYVDYAVSNVEGKKKGTVVTLERIGQMPMPVEFCVELQDGEKQYFYVPLKATRSMKSILESWTALDPWPWTYPYYELNLDVNFEDIKSITLDPSKRVADVNAKNDSYMKGKGGKVVFKPAEK